MNVRAVSLGISAAAICACGGGGGTSNGNGIVTPPPPPPVAAQHGQFKDSNVSGLEFSTTSESGVTGAQGEFTFRSGETVTFSLGGVTLGSIEGRSIVTPVDFVPGGDATSPEVLNIVRFLLMLDENEDSDDGISISSAVRAVSENWSQVDFTSDNLNDELVLIVSDVASVENRTPVVPALDVALEHLRSNLNCLVSGVFRGTFRDQEIVQFLVDPNDGAIKGNYLGSAQDFVSSGPVSQDQNRTFRILRASDGSAFEGGFEGFDRLSGVWSADGSSGTFSADRILGDTAASLRLTGEWGRGSITASLTETNVFDVHSNGQVAAESFELATGTTHTGTGTLDGEFISVTWDSGTQTQGTLSAFSLSASGNWVNNGRSGTWRANGCRLN